jgi:hypothetical protein
MGLTALPALLIPQSVQAADLITATLRPETSAVFDTYVREVEDRINTEASATRFLWAEADPDRMRRVQKGDVVIEGWNGKGTRDIAGGIIHDWIGSVFVPGTTLEKTLHLTQDYNNHKNIYKPEVIDSRLISRSGNDFKIYYRFLKKKVITVVMNTNHTVIYHPVSKTRLHSGSFTTRIAEVSDPGKPSERELPPGKDHGFMWRLNSYWRFEEKDGGTYLECQAVSLSREVPVGLGWMITPIVRGLPRESLTNMLVETRQALS